MPNEETRGREGDVMGPYLPTVPDDTDGVSVVEKEGNVNPRTSSLSPLSKITRHPVRYLREVETHQENTTPGNTYTRGISVTRPFQESKVVRDGDS